MTHPELSLVDVLVMPPVHPLLVKFGAFIMLTQFMTSFYALIYLVFGLFKNIIIRFLTCVTYFCR